MVTYEHLQRVLHRLVYTANPRSGNRVIYHHPESAIDVILPRMRRHEVLRPIDLRWLSFGPILRSSVNRKQVRCRTDHQ